MDAAAVARSYEAMRADLLARMIRPDDARVDSAVAAVRDAVAAGGPIRAGGVVLGWDVESGCVSRRTA